MGSTREKNMSVILSIKIYFMNNSKILELMISLLSFQLSFHSISKLAKNYILYTMLQESKSCEKVRLFFWGGGGKTFSFLHVQEFLSIAKENMIWKM